MKQLSKNKTRFNLFDAVVTAALVLVLIAGAFYLFPKHEEKSPATVVMTFSDVRYDIATSLREDDVVYDADGDVALGKIKSVEISPDTLTYRDEETGDDTEVPYPENTVCRVRVVLALDDAVPSEDGANVSSVTLSEEKTASIRTKTFSATGVCESILFDGGSK